ncbi:MAG TPA: hypothetical protein PL166_11905 [Candidatus Contendobacter sp.]|nr:hypothetical protein [Candidatus Contendobacter sp.]HRD50285.1 hypothetical protein [Candidatus Contendobacter sp.]
MPITLKPERQRSLFAILDIGFADLASGVAGTAIQLPPNAEVVSGSITVNTVFNSATSDTLSLGDSAAGARYANAVNLRALGRTALTVTGYRTLPTTRAITATWTGVGAAPTTGSVRVIVEYLQGHRADLTQD